MGADNISIIAVFPNPIKQRDINKMRKYLAEVKQFLDVLDDDLRETLEGMKSNDRGGISKQVEDICTLHELKFSKETKFRITCAIMDSIDSSDSLSYPEELDQDPPYGTGYRDSASRTVKLGGKCWDVVSCGELSWGDEPSGSGYGELKQAFRWGTVQMLGGQ